MIAPGFKNRYFSLCAIAATHSLVRLAKTASAFLERDRTHKVLKIIDEEEDPPPLEESLEEGSKPCYCNIFFACAAHTALKLSRQKKPPLCKCRYTKTGIAPPCLPKIQ